MATVSDWQLPLHEVILTGAVDVHVTLGRGSRVIYFGLFSLRWQWSPLRGGAPANSANGTVE